MGCFGVLKKPAEASLDGASALSSALSVTGGSTSPTPALSDTPQVTSYFLLWYLFNIGYNIYNKQALNVLAYPWTIATIQMAAGIPYFAGLWATGIRKAPKL